MQYILAILITFSTISISHASATSPGDYYVLVGKLNVRSAASKSGKIINEIHRGQKVEVLEIKKDWARLSPNYDKNNKDGTGNASHWTAARYLSSNRPVKAKQRKVFSSIKKAIKLSDDFSTHQNIFVSASQKLINDGSCKLTDFKEMGGWWRSLHHRPKPVYVTYCGGTKNNNRIYLNAKTGDTFK